MNTTGRNSKAVYSKNVSQKLQLSFLLYACGQEAEKKHTEQNKKATNNKPT